MAYTLSRLAPGSYDVLLHGVIIASLVQSGIQRSREEPWWMALRTVAELMAHGRRTPK